MTIDANGFKAESFTEILTRLSNGLKNIYGQDINLDQDSPDGQQLGIQANIISDFQDLALYIYNSMDPDLADGANFDKLLKLLARTRLPSSRSTVDIEMVLNKTVSIPASYTIKDLNNQNWIIGTAQTLDAGTHLVSFYSEDWGNITAEPNTINEQVTILTEVVSINNPENAISGRDEESIVQVRERRNKILEINASSTIGSIIGKILDLNGVIDAIGYENATDEYDPTRDMKRNSIWVIVKGGDIAEITEIIAKDKNGGTGQKGQVETVYIEKFARKDGSVRELHHNIKFDRPREISIHIKFKVSRKISTQSIDIEHIKDTLANKEFYIAQNITVTELYSTIYSAATNYIATNLEVSKDGVVWDSVFLQAGYDEEFIIEKSNIEIEELI
ncbi:baseplate J/gp47 family protein [Aliarcobacter cryaerophilus]|uniref:baseplate J/gp47 family protein n=1 Tax=Aliarcobacter cryaerophilus TaxID=28198 RepID=UPI0021B3BD7F|nr:baseplate J/gp47 family protein [Aliarcobacter cryaerophilus]MCT7432488.1 baseplate J/gp47 family protein [Aliarcobacter cryaerophilus]